ncbi:MAG: 16S rRNA (cytosine(967)-C(5))-methyltransferase RsmB [Cellulosilyticaceae bacterium]
MKSAREQIVDLLVAMEKDESYIQLALKEALEQVDEKDRKFANEVVYGTIKYKLRLDYIIGQFSKTPIKKMKPFVRALLRMSTYQLIFLDKVPDSAVTNEAVKIMHRRKMSNLSSFVNGVLRTIARQKENITYPDKKNNQVEYLSVYYSVPEWIITLWTKQYGVDVAEKLLEELNERAHVSIRHNPLKVDKNTFISHIEEEGVEIVSKSQVAEGYIVKQTGNIAKHNSYQAGEWTVQDESAMLVAHVVDAQKEDMVLDMCSAPGGKTTHIATLMENTGTVIAADLYAHKIEIVQKNAKRLGLTNIQTYVHDGTVLNENWIGKFDKILLDAPCSGLGIIKRKPDIRYRQSVEAMEQIVALQKILLEKAVEYLKPGGVLVYSTCTLNTKENEEMVTYAETVLGLEKDTIERYLPECLKKELKDNAYIEILPTVMGSDGFFIAKLRKKG